MPSSESQPKTPRPILALSESTQDALDDLVTVATAQQHTDLDAALARLHAAIDADHHPELWDMLDEISGLAIGLSIVTAEASYLFGLLCGRRGAQK